jgi:hypothetical protein
MVRVAFAFVCLTMLAACGTGDDRNGVAAASGSAHFVNSPDNARSLALRDAYVDFSFDYPARWSETPQPIDGTAQNYVRVAAPMVNGYEPEAFLVGYASGTGNAGRDRASIPAATQALAEQFGATLQDYHIVLSGPGRVAGYDSYGWRFTASAPGVGGEPRVQIFGRGELILPPGATRGVTLVAIATGRSSEAHNAAEIGQSGALKAIFDSFHLVASTAPAPPPGIANPPRDTSALQNETGTTPAPPTPPTPPVGRPRPAPPAPPATSSPPPAAHPTPATPPPGAAPVPAPAPAPAAPPPATPPPTPPRAPPAGNGQ